MPSYPLITLGSRFTTILKTFSTGDAVGEQTLSAALIQRVADDQQVRFAGGPRDIFTPALTLWGFLAQVLSGSKSCVAAVARIMVLRVGLSLPPCSANTGAYCKARHKLPEPFLRELTHTVGAAVEDQAPESWRWHRQRGAAGRWLHLHPSGYQGQSGGLSATVLAKAWLGFPHDPAPWCC